MPIRSETALLMVAVAALMTLLTRALPFILFGGKREMPEAFIVLGRILPPAMIGSLVIYCIRQINIKEPSSVLTEMLGLALVVILHKWKANTVLSIVGGTVFYMLLKSLL